MVYWCLSPFLPDHIQLTFCRHLFHSLSLTLRQPPSQPMKQQPSASDVALECFWIAWSNDFQCSAEYPTSDVTIGSGKEWTQMVSTRLSRSYHPITTSPPPIPTSRNLCSGYHSVRLCFLGSFLVLTLSRCALKLRDQVGDFNPDDHCSSFPIVLCSRHKDRGTKPVSQDLHYSVSIQRARSGRCSTNEKRSVPFTYSYR